MEHFLVNSQIPTSSRPCFWNLYYFWHIFHCRFLTEVRKLSFLLTKQRIFAPRYVHCLYFSSINDIPCNPLSQCFEMVTVLKLLGQVHCHYVICFYWPSTNRLFCHLLAKFLVPLKNVLELTSIWFMSCSSFNIWSLILVSCLYMKWSDQVIIDIFYTAVFFPYLFFFNFAHCTGV